MLAPRLAVTALILALSAGAQTHKTRNVVLITSDGLRWQDLTRGIDPLLSHEKTAGMEKAAELRKRYERPTDKERREALLPFFWTKLVPKGVMLTDVKVTNGIRVSYPGYSELLTGRANDEVIKNNDPIQNPNETVLEYLRDKLHLKREQVALVASWNNFRNIGEHTRGSIYINDGYEKMDLPKAPGVALMSNLQSQATTPWDGARLDVFTFEMGLEYLKIAKPRVMFISLNDTDEWAHARRYDLVLDSISNFDHYLERLWNTIQSMPQYRNSTTLIVTADHGRGSRVEDWGSHGKNVVGAEHIWLAAIGPDTPAVGESPASAEQRDVAPTILALMGLDPAGYTVAKGKPIPVVLGK